MPLPNPGMVFTPFDPLPASDLNDIVENIEGLQDWSAFDNATFPIALIDDGDIPTAKIADGAVTSTKLAENFLRGRVQANTSNSAPTGLTIQTGWGYITGDGVAGTRTKDVTFPTPFTTLHSLTSGSIGYKSGNPAPTAITDFNTDGPGTDPFSIQSGAVTLSGFRARAAREDAGTWATSDYAGFSWIAIGVV